MSLLDPKDTEQSIEVTADVPGDTVPNWAPGEDVWHALGSKEVADTTVTLTTVDDDAPIPDATSIDKTIAIANTPAMNMRTPSIRENRLTPVHRNYDPRT